MFDDRNVNMCCKNATCWLSSSTSTALSTGEEVSSIQVSATRGPGGVLKLGTEGPEDVGGEGNLASNHSHFLILKFSLFSILRCFSLHDEGSHNLKVLAM